MGRGMVGRGVRIMKIWKFLAIAMIIPAANKNEALPVQAEEAPYRAAPSFLPFSYTDDSIFPDPDMISFPGKEEQLYFISLKEQADKYGGMQGMISDQDESPGVCWASMADFWGSGDQVFAIVYRSAGEEKDASDTAAYTLEIYRRDESELTRLFSTTVSEIPALINSGGQDLLLITDTAGAELLTYDNGKISVLHGLTSGGSDVFLDGEIISQGNYWDTLFSWKTSLRETNDSIIWYEGYNGTMHAVNADIYDAVTRMTGRQLGVVPSDGEAYLYHSYLTEFMKECCAAASSDAGDLSSAQGDFYFKDLDGDGHLEVISHFLNESNGNEHWNVATSDGTVINGKTISNRQVNAIFSDGNICVESHGSEEDEYKNAQYSSCFSVSEGRLKDNRIGFSWQYSDYGGLQYLNGEPVSSESFAFHETNLEEEEGAGYDVYSNWEDLPDVLNSICP